jgi:hypothetical protein
MQMKAVRLFPIAFIADVHGFLFLAPYLLLVMLASYLVRRRGAARPVLAAVPIGRH